MSEATAQPPFITRTHRAFFVVEFRVESLMSANIKEIQTQLMALFDDESHNKAIFDLRRVRDISSQFLGIIIAIHTHLSKRRGKLILVGLNDKLNELMHITRLDRIIAIAPTVNDVVERDAFL